MRKKTLFSPTSIAGCQVWLDASDITTVVLSGTSVTTWTSKVANPSIVATSVTAPTYTTYNTYPALQFNGTSTKMTTGTISSYGAAGSTWIAASVNLTAVTSSTPTDASVVIATNGSPERAIRYDMNTSATCYSIHSSVIRQDTNNNANGVRGFIDTPSSFQSYTNGTNFVTTNTAVTFQTSVNQSFVLGQWNVGWLNGYIFECVVYDGILTLSQYQQVEGYLATKWGFRNLLPQGHPGISSVLYPLSRQPLMFPLGYYNLFSPTSITGCSLWLDAADLTKISLSGSSVTQMIDKSSNAYTLTGSVGSYPTRSATLNGQPVISSATGQYLTITNFNQNFTTATCFAVARPTEDITPLNKYTNGYPLYVFINGSTSGNFQWWMGYANQAQTADTSKFTASINKNGTGLVSGSLGGASPSTYNPINTTLLISGVMSGSTGTNVVNLNGSSVSLSVNSSGTFASQTPTLQCIGLSSGQSFGYDFAETLIYGTTLSTTQIQQVESYLAQKWGLTASLPSSHINATKPAGTPAIVAQVYPQIQRNLISLPRI